MVTNTRLQRHAPQTHATPCPQEATLRYAQLKQEALFDSLERNILSPISFPMSLITKEPKHRHRVPLAWQRCIIPHPLPSPSPASRLPTIPIAVANQTWPTNASCSDSASDWTSSLPPPPPEGVPGRGTSASGRTSASP
jgi:hypothetical protein